MTTRIALPAVVAVALVALTGCGAAAPAPEVPVDEVLSVPAIAGNWVMTRTVTELDMDIDLEVGTEQTRYLIIEEPRCDATSCSGTLGVSADPAYLEGGADAVEMAYTFDGSVLTYTSRANPESIDCVFTDTGEVALEGAWDQVTDYEFSVAAGGDESVDGFEGTGTHEWLVADQQALDDAQCPAGGTIQYSASLYRA